MANGLPLLNCSYQFDPFPTRIGVNLKATVYEVGGVDPTNIIHADQAWYVDVEWELTGGLLHHLCGEWCVSVVLESIGPGDEYRFPPSCDRVRIDPCIKGPYKHRIEVAAGKVGAEEPCGTLYIVGVILGSLDACGHAGQLHAHCTGDELHFVPRHE